MGLYIKNKGHKEKMFSNVFCCFFLEGEGGHSRFFLFPYFGPDNQVGGGTFRGQQRKICEDLQAESGVLNM